MIELLGLYSWTILAAIVTGAALALLGAHLTTRQKSIQTLCVGQGATFGVLLGLAIVKTYFHNADMEHTIWPLLSGIFFSIFSYVVSEKVSRRAISKNTFFIAVYALLWSMGYMVSAIFPAAEGHIASVFFGDLVTISRGESIFFAGIGLLALLLLVIPWRRHSIRSFEIASQEEVALSVHGTDRIFYPLAILMICLSVQFMGLLFTLTALFLPTVLLGFSNRVGVGRHLLLAALVMAIASASGFILSLGIPSMPTVPGIALTVFLLLSCWLIIEKIIAGRKI